MNWRTSLSMLAWTLGVFFVGCQSTESGDAATDHGNGGGGAGGDGSAPVVKCKEPTSGPTHHDSNISADETWTAEGSPHILDWDVYVLEGATLTIEPCAEILVDEGMALGVHGGELLAEGTADAPIHVAGLDGAAWSKLEFSAPGTARLAHVDIEGGGNHDFDDSASVLVRSDGTPPAVAVLHVDHVNVTKSAGLGVKVFGLATFIEGSHDLTITGCGSEDYPYPISIEEHSMDALPSGDYTGNLKDEILLNLVGSGTAGDGLKVDATLHERGVPYRLDGGFNVAANEDGKLATMTIEPGVTIKVPEGKSFQIEHWTGDAPATGALKALGTAEKPIVFTSAADAPAPGDWQGLWFGGVPSADNQLDHVIIEYAGADCGCSLSSCNDLSEYEGAVLITNYPDGGNAFITNSEIRQIAGHGIVEGWAFPDGDPRNEQIDFTPTNTFDVTGCVQTLPGNTTSGGCPSPKPSCQ
jgi:hypothetical protein